MYKKSLFIFRRDLRVPDNTGLIAALKQSEKVIPAFIFDPRQIEKHPYRSDFGLQFLIESLADLDESLRDRDGKLFIFKGKAEEKLAEIIKSEEVDAVIFNKDYTPFSVKRDKAIGKVCAKAEVNCHGFHDLCLQTPGGVLKKDATPYTVYTPYMKCSIQIPVNKPRKNPAKNYAKQVKSKVWKNALQKLANPEFSGTEKGGRKVALSVLKKLKQFTDYDDNRNIPSVPGTTRLSAHFKFGTVSAREAFYLFEKAFGRSCTLIRELYWRDFFTHIGHHFPHVYKGAYRPMYDGINWENDKKKFKKWCEGKTGFPIVDAGMRELNETGFMHNRVRMITASFLVKDLHVDWRWGEKYFATKLVDYDPAVNNGNWQWAASTGCDAQPYFRIFNPWLQQKRFDPNCTYIKQWVPELKELTPKEIHKLLDGNLFTSDYPDPIIVHKERSAKAKELFQEVRQKS